MTLTVEVVKAGRFWPCWLRRHGSCRIAYRARTAVAYPAEAARIGAVGWIRCGCPCHGELPTT